MLTTLQQYKFAFGKCREVFVQKTNDYGTAWRILRPSSLTDQIFIKAQRIRTIEEKGTQQVADNMSDEFSGIINYCVMALIQLSLPQNTPVDLPLDEALLLYDLQVADSETLMQRKNHDYGEAWRLMRVSSFTDLILMKVLRIKQIENNDGKTIVSEGVAANYQDMINYAIFALIKMGEASGGLWCLLVKQHLIWQHDT